MKTVLMVALLLVSGVASSTRAFADESDIISGICPRGTLLQVVGSFQTAGADVTSIRASGAKVIASRVACGGTACTATLYDSAAVPTSNTTVVTDPNVRDEPGAPANESRWTAYSPPLDFKNGVAFHDDSNVLGIGLYECRP